MKWKPLKNSSRLINFPPHPSQSRGERERGMKGEKVSFPFLSPAMNANIVGVFLTSTHNKLSPFPPLSPQKLRFYVLTSYKQFSTNYENEKSGVNASPE